MIRRIPKRVCGFCVSGLHDKCERVMDIKSRGVVIRVKCNCQVCNNRRLDEYVEKEEKGEAICC